MNTEDSLHLNISFSYHLWLHIKICMFLIQSFIITFPKRYRSILRLRLRRFKQDEMISCCIMSVCLCSSLSCYTPPKWLLWAPPTDRTRVFFQCIFKVTHVITRSVNYTRQRQWFKLHASYVVPAMGTTNCCPVEGWLSPQLWPPVRPLAALLGPFPGQRGPTLGTSVAVYCHKPPKWFFWAPLTTRTWVECCYNQFIGELIEIMLHFILFIENSTLSNEYSCRTMLYIIMN